MRPRYAEEVFDDLTELAGLRRGSRVLEVGCGTGQATLPLARRGYEVVAVELGSGLARVAGEKLAEFPAVKVVNAAFEDWRLPAELFDLVVAATAFHWLEPSVRLVKAAAALRHGGALGVISTHHIAGGDAQFFVDVRRCYERWMPDTPMGLQLPAAAELVSDREELEQGGLFGAVVFRRYEHEQVYSTHDYLELLMSYSGHRALGPRSRASLLACVGELMDGRYKGRVAKRSMTELAVAHSVAAS